MAVLFCLSRLAGETDVVCGRVTADLNLPIVSQISQEVLPDSPHPALGPS